MIRLPGSRSTENSWQAAGEHPEDDASALLRLVPDLAEHDIFVCGPPAWIASVKRAARRAGARKDQLHSEDFAW